MASGTDIDAKLAAFLAEEMEESPVLASSVGYDGFDDRLGEHSAADYERRDRRNSERIAEFEAITSDSLSIDEQIDRDLVLSTLRGRAVMQDWQSWRRDPATYLGPCLQGVFALFLHRLHPARDLVRHASSRMHATAGVLQHAKANIDPDLAHRLIVERAIGQCRAGIRYARELVPAEIGEPALKNQLAEAGELAARAFEDFERHLTEEVLPKARGDFAIGEQRYSALLREKELLGFGAPALREKGRAAWAELAQEMAALSTTITGAPDWRAAVRDLNGDHPASPEEMRIEYETVTERARQFLRDNELVTLPDGERCLVVPSPPFQRPVLAVASYGAPPAFKPSVIGHFFVPFPPDGTAPDEVQKRLETNSYHSIPTVAVHEAYPGHHWHLTWMQQTARPIRRVLRTPYFTEGWALYAERLMREHGFFDDPRQELCHLDARIFRAARIVVDTSLHIGDMGVEEAVEFMQKSASLSEPTARAEVGRYCAWPTQASSYLTGSLEIERIRARYLAENRGDVRSFNDTIAASGGLPIELAERAVFG